MYDIHQDTPSSQGPHTKKKSSTPARRSRKKIPFTGENITFNPVRGEAALWVAVITQAMMDALSKSKNSETQYYKHEAIRWLTENSKDFIEVCLNAGLCPDDVRCKAKKAIATPKLWRAEAGTGKRYMERKTYREKQKQRTLRIKNIIPPSRIQIIPTVWQ